MKITIRQIECFLAVAELGSFSRAGERLNTAQPALSQAIKDLEGELSLRLFDRTTRRVELTDAGREFRDAAADILEQLGDAVRNVREIADKKRGRLRIAAPPLLAGIYLPAAIAEFRERFPGIVVTLQDVGTEEIMEMVRSGGADCGVGTFSAAVTEFERTVLLRDKLVLVGRAFPDLPAHEPVSWRYLEGQPVIALTRSSGIRLLVEIGFETAGVAFQPAFEVSQISTVLAMVEAGLGLAVLPSYALEDAKARDLVGLPLAEPTISREVVIIQHADRSRSPAVREFVAIMQARSRRIGRNL